MIRTFISTCFLFLYFNIGYCQSGLFSYDLSNYNPAYVGMYDSYNLTFYTLNYIYKTGLSDYSTGRVAFNIPVKKAHAAIGMHANYSMGFSNNYLNTGLTYCYRHDFNEKISLLFGARASWYQYGFKYIDPVIFYFNSRPISKMNLFNLDLGLWFKLYRFNIGITNDHYNNHQKIYYNQPLPQDYSYYIPKSTCNIIITYNAKLGNKLQFDNSLILYNISNTRYHSQMMSLNNELIINNKILAGLTIHANLNSNQEIDEIKLHPNIGFNITNRARFLMSFMLINFTSSSYYYHDFDYKQVEGILIFNL